jgi:hypothetical protein
VLWLSRVIRTKPCGCGRAKISPPTRTPPAPAAGRGCLCKMPAGVLTCCLCFALLPPCFASSRASVAPSTADCQSRCCTHRGFGATISWYLVGSFARGMRYDSDGFVKATWPSSGHWELTPMAYATAHWTMFAKPGWEMLPCPELQIPGARGSSTTNCALPSGGNYAALVGSSGNLTLILETFEHNASTCFRCDPKEPWAVAARQTATFRFVGLRGGHDALAVWRSCAAWDTRTESWLQPQPDVPVKPDGSFDISLRKNCLYTITTTRGQTRPYDTSERTAPKSAAFKLPYSTTFDGPLDGGEGSYLGDQMGKWEAALAADPSHGTVMRQVVQDDNLAITSDLRWQRLSQNVPLTILGDLFMEDLSVASDFLLETSHTAMGNRSFAGVALRVTAAGWPFRGGGLSPMVPGLFLRVKSSGEWQLCAEANCTRACVTAHGCPEGSQPLDFVIASGQIQGTQNDMVNRWHRLQLSVQGAIASATLDRAPLFTNLSVASKRGLPQSDPYARAGAGWAALTSSFSGVQFDRLKLDGHHQGNTSAVESCHVGVPAAGVKVGSFPCDAPAATNGWQVNATTGLVHIIVGGSSSDLCLTAEVTPPAAAEASCAGFLNSTGGGCAGLTHVPSGDSGASACAQTCCGDLRCGTWQWNAKTGCWTGSCPSLTPDGNTTTGWRKIQSSGLGNVVLGSCAAAAAKALRFDSSTGRITMASNASVCVAIRPKQGATSGAAPAAAVLQVCKPLPCDFQQFQVDRYSGAVRHKSGFCVEPCTGPAFHNGICAGGASVTVSGWPAFRDCCLGVC